MQHYWLNDWKNFDISKLARCFKIGSESFSDIDILLASYSASDDEGYAFILFRQNSELFEINASHDSVADFAGQWQPEPTSVEALLFRLNRGNLGKKEASQNVFADELSLLLKQFMQ